MIRRVIRSLHRAGQIATLLRISAVLTLVGLALMVWSMIEPTPMPVILAMSAGQVLGTLAFGLFIYAVVVDQLRAQRAKATSSAAQPPASPGSAGEAPP